MFICLNLIYFYKVIKASEARGLVQQYIRKHKAFRLYRKSCVYLQSRQL